MKLKRFVAADTRTAMQQIKATLGPDAVILSSHQVEGGIEVVAAIDYDESVLTQKAAAASALPPSNVPRPSQPVTSLDEMRQEILTLRGMLETQLRGGQVGSDEPLHALLMRKLSDMGMSYSVASQLLQGVHKTWHQQQGWQFILDKLNQVIPIHDRARIEEGGVFAFVGPTGVGKTTTLAKIAARFVLRFGAEQLGLVTMDTYRIAAQEQLILYGKILGVNVSVAQDEASLTRILQQLSTKKLILIDTAGMSPEDSRVDEQMHMLSKHLHSINTVVVLPATSQYQVLEDALRLYKTGDIRQCVITKLDESRAIGGVLSAIIAADIPVSYLTHGQRVPEDIKMATSHQLTDLFAEQAQALERSQEGGRMSGPQTGRAYYV